MFKNHYSLIICIFLAFSSCTDEVKTSFSEVSISTKTNHIVEVNVPEAIGNKIIADQINGEISKSISKALSIGEPNSNISKSIKESIDNFNSEYEQFINDFPETEIPWEAQIDGEVVYQSPEIISIAITSYVNTGGAHGISNISFLNFNAENGQKLTNEQLITDISAFKILAKPYFDKSIAEKDNAVFDAKDYQLPANIAYTKDGLVLLYNTYEIAPYSTGIIEFKIPFEKAESYLVFNSL
ncbi:DUF3298 and DUF4163 domain-containing protein [Flavisericum labens]|uniref:DUF3298 and DUF4163 domain-containing protein n=1 Tax=Flavisericum labens TaxID=3377112 RepID=UPI00387B2F64